MAFKAIEHVVGVSHVSVINWVKKYGKALSHAAEQGEKLSAVALDELCIYVGSKKKIWIWLVVDSVGKRVLDFTLGGRSAQTGDKLYKAIYHA